MDWVSQGRNGVRKVENHLSKALLAGVRWRSAIKPSAKPNHVAKITASIMFTEFSEVGKYHVAPAADCGYAHRRATYRYTRCRLVVCPQAGLTLGIRTMNSKKA